MPRKPGDMWSHCRICGALVQDKNLAEHIKKRHPNGV